MKILLLDSKTSNELPGEISEALGNDIPLKKDGWQFNWRSLYKTEGSLFYKLVLLNQDRAEIQGMIMITLINNEMVYLNNVEVAPWNYGKNGRYANVAGCLLAFVCKKSFELGRKHYTGFLSFDSKTALIDLYRKKYGATLAIGHKLFFDPIAGEQLIVKFLGENINF